MNCVEKRLCYSRGSGLTLCSLLCPCAQAAAGTPPRGGCTVWGGRLLQGHTASVLGNVSGTQKGLKALEKGGSMCLALHFIQTWMFFALADHRLPPWRRGPRECGLQSAGTAFSAQQWWVQGQMCPPDGPQHNLSSFYP